MTSPKTNTTILYSVLLVIGTIQLVMVCQQILNQWTISHPLRQFLLGLRFLINLAFLVIFSIKLKKITVPDNKDAEEISE